MELRLTPHEVPRPLPINHGAEDVSAWRNEFDSYYQQMHLFREMEIDEILMALSAFSARASEIRSQLVRVDTRLHTAFRTKEVDPFLEEVDRQFKLWSRVQSVRDMDFRLSGGQT